MVLFFNSPWLPSYLKNVQNETTKCFSVGNTKGATREGAKGAEAPPLAKSELRKKIKYRIVLIFFCFNDLKLRNLTNL